MNLAHWDLERQALSAEIDRLLSAKRPARVAQSRLSLYKQQVLQDEAAFAGRLRHLRAVAAREPLLLPLERAMVHGAATCAELLATCDQHQGEVMAQAFWLNLLQARLTGGAAAGPLGEEELLSLSVRQAELRQTEAYLRQRLELLDEHCGRLRERYAQLDLIEANKTAAQTFAIRLGATLAAARANPSLLTLGKALQTAAGFLKKSKQLSDLTRSTGQLSQRSSEFIGRCTAQLLRRGDGAAEAPSRDTALAASAAAISVLADEVATSYGALAAAPLPETAPIRVQKRRKGARKKPPGVTS